MQKLTEIKKIFLKNLCKKKFNNDFELFIQKFWENASLCKSWEYVFENKKIILEYQEKNILRIKIFFKSFQLDQVNIDLFIKKCKYHSENNIISLNFFNKLKFNKIKFTNGPFKNFLFDIFWKNKKIFASNKNVNIKVTEENYKNFIFF